jgi:hypothetical protein
MMMQDWLYKFCSVGCSRLVCGVGCRWEVGVEYCKTLKLPSDADTEESTKPHEISNSIASIFAVLMS